jgi:CheY-like chemotaxis protein
MNTTTDSPVVNAPVAGAPHGTPRHILVVDDDPFVRSVEELFLQYAGFAVDTANCGSSAWELLVHGNYDLLVTDYMMPGMSGIALTRQLRVAGLNLPVILVTGSIDSLDPSGLNQDPWTHIRHCLGKPFTEAELVAAVCESVGLAVSEHLRRGRR